MTKIPKAGPIDLNVMALPRKKPAVFNHPLGFPLYDSLAMDMHAMNYAEPLLAEIQGLRAALALAVRQGEHDMLLTGEELRKCCAALHPNATPPAA